VRLYTDSNYVRDGITKWIPGWRATAGGSGRQDSGEDAELWQRLLDAAEPHRVEWHMG
jgi:ribonuclease HI